MYRLGGRGPAQVGPGGLDGQALPLRQGGEALLLLVPLLVLLLQGKGAVVGRPPAGGEHRLPSGVEGFPLHLQGEGHLLVLEGGQQHRQEAADDQIIDVALRPGEPPQLHRLLGGEEGVVVGDLGGVDQIFGLEGTAAQQLRRQGLVVLHHHAAQPLRQGRNHVVGDVAGVGAGVGDHLMDLIEVLEDGQGLLGGVGVLLVGVPLELGEVVGRRGRGLPAGALEAGHHPLLPRQPGGQRLRPLPVKEPRLAVRIPPGGGEAGQLRGDRPELLGDEAADGLLPLHNEGQGGGLHPPGGELGVVPARQGPGDVEAHQPVGLAAGAGGAEQVVVLRRGPQVGEALPDGLVGLGGDPQPPGRPLPPGLLQNPPGHQLPLPARVGGDDQLAHVPPAKLGLDGPELPAGLGDHHRLHPLGQHGQGEHIPLGPRLVVVLRGRQLHQVPQGPGDDVLLPLQIPLSGLFAAQHPGQFPSYRGLFRQNQCFRHTIFS